MPLIDLNGLGHFKDKENAMIAENFSATKAYSAGDYCYYNGTLYRFKTAHAAGAWTTSDVEAAKLAHDVRDLKESISDYNKYVIGVPFFNPSIIKDSYLDDNGAIIQQANMYYTSLIEVMPNTQYEFLFPISETTNILRIHGYNDQEEWQEMIFKESVGGDPANADKIASIVFDVPDNIKYIRFSTRINKIIVALYKKGSGDISAQVETLTDSALETIDFNFNDTVPQSVDIRESEPYDYISGSNYKYLYFIPVAKYKTATLLTTYTWGSYFALLKSNNWTVGNIPDFCDGHVGITTLQRNVALEVPIPSDCKYIAIRIDNQNTTAFSATLFATANSKINANTKEIDNLTKIANVPINVRFRGLMSAFGNDEGKLRVFGTRNFKYFEEIGISYQPAKGHQRCRDPFFIIYKGAFYIFYTDAVNFRDENNTIGVVKTYDFIDYEEFDPIVCNENFKICWAPSIFEENGQYYLAVTGSTVDYTATSQYIYDLDMESLSVSNEQLITITGLTRTLDFHFYKFNDSYYAIGKNEARSTSVIAKSTTLKGEYTVLADNMYTGFPEEGQMIMRLDNGQYRLYLNDFSTNKLIKYVDIPDINNPLQNISAVKTISHNSAIVLFHAYIYDMNRAYSFES